MTEIGILIPNTAQASAPPVLLPYQQAWIADDSQLKVGEKSRRIGLTWAEAADDVLIAAESGGRNVYYIGYNQDMAIEYIEACAMWAKAFNRAAGEVEEGIWEEEKEDKHIKTYTIRFPGSGRRIVALSSRPANLRGKQGVVVVDEAAFHDQLGELIKAALALLIWGGMVRIISTHDGVNNEFNQLITDIRAKRRKGSVFKCTFREAVEQGLYRRVCLRLGKEWSQEEEDAWIEEVYSFYGADAEEELDVIPSLSAGAYLPGVLIESRMVAGIPIIRLTRDNNWGKYPEHLRRAEIADWCKEELLPLLEKLDPQREHVFGEDFARSGDLTVLPVGEIGQDMVRRVKFAVELQNIPFAQQQQIVFFILDRLPRLRGAAFDARGNGQQLAEAAADRYGSVIHMIMLSDKWYGENLPQFKAAFEDAMIEIAMDADWASDLRALKVIEGVPKLPKGKTNEKGQEQRHGDAAIALVMLWFASIQDVAEYAYEAVARHDKRRDHDRDIQTTAGFSRMMGAM